MEYCDDGDLAKKIKERATSMAKTGLDDYFAEHQVLVWFTMLALGVKHCHDRRIIHRDLKAENVFLNRSGMVKIGDFGVSKVLARTHAVAKT